MPTSTAPLDDRVQPSDELEDEPSGSDEQELRARIRADLPPDTFDRQPQRALWFVPLVATTVGGVVVLLTVQPAWWISVLIALVVGESLAATGFLAHETMHGAVVRSTRLQNFFGYIAFMPFLVSPSLWRVWHNQIHHSKTNAGNSDPDSFGTLARYKRMPSTRYVAQLAPGSRKWRSAFFFAYWFTFHGQVVLWIQARYLKRTFARLDRRRASVESLLALTGWLAIGAMTVWVAGWASLLYVMVIPFVVGNAIVMGYIATNHFMRPQTKENNPLENSMSVTTLPVIDHLHFNFSHHVEHHMFPRMSAKHAPRVRAWLIEHVGDRYVSPSHAKALAYLYKTPRVYLDSHTLVDPDDLDHRIDTALLAEELVA
jgi:fatty acid desaturase